MIEGSKIKDKQKDDQLFVSILTDIVNGERSISIKEIEEQIKQFAMKEAA